MTATSRAIVRTGVAQFFGGTTYDSIFRCYRNGPLNSYGLSTVRPYQPKKLPDLDYVLGQAPGRGMGAVMVLEMNETRDTDLNITQLPGSGAAQRKLVYPIQCHVFHMAHMNFAEDAEADVDALDQALHEQIYSDPTLGATPGVYQAGLDAFGIRTLIDQPELWEDDEIVLTHFRVVFDAELGIFVS
jgi:hypothetical protein